MLFLAFIIIVVSGLIAYIGDLVGRKMGRKRLTMLGLRPRHTAIIISVSMGMLIAAVTLGLTILVNQQIRELFYTPISKLKTQLRDTTLRVDQANGKLAVTEAEAVRARRQLATQATQLQDKAVQLARVDRALLASQRQRARINADLVQARANLTSVEGLLHGARQRLHVAQAKLVDAQTKLTATNKQLIGISQQSFQLQEQVTALQQTRDELRERVDVLKEFAQISFSPLAFTSGEEIVSGVLPAESAAADRITQLNQFLHVAERIIRQRSPEMPDDAPTLLYLGGDATHPVHLTETEALHALAARMTALHATHPIIIRLAPVNNVPVKGPALIAVQSVELIENTPVYAAGAEIARITLPVSEETATADAMARLADELLTTRVPTALRSKGVLLLTRRFDPHQPAQIPAVALSRIPWSELFAVARQVATHRGQVSVLAKARSAVARSGPVEISFEVIDSGP